ncbi:MAG: CCA tRNA nucleotidyltransferase [Roseobacter sp.]
MDRPNDIILPVSTAWLKDADTRAVYDALASDGGSAFFVGGCVRDALLGVPGADVDLSTPWEPQDVIRLAKAAGLKAVPTGIDHGTITVVSGGHGFEVTTFRRDVETDGRRAVVAYSTNIADDARRRDFTLNALYATIDGRVVDPLGGVADCLNRRIRFIEDAGQRIQEDYLRILRYYRFHAWYSDPAAGFDPDALDAISANSDGLKTLSAERVGSEMLRLLAAPDPTPAIAVMRQTGCLPRILPGSDDRLLGPVVHLGASIGAPIDSIVRLAALGGEDVADRLRLSRADARHLNDITQAAYGPQPLAEVAYRKGSDVARAASMIRAALAQMPVNATDLEAITTATKAEFPVTAADLMPEYQGPALGEKLAKLEARWIESGFTLTREDLVTSG